MNEKNNTLTQYNKSYIQKVSNQIAITNKVILHNKTLSAFDYLIAGFKCGLNNDPIGSISNYSKSLELKPNLYVVYKGIAAAKINLNDFQGAINDCNIAIENVPDFWECYALRGSAYLIFEKYDEVINDCNKVIEINPDYSFAYRNRGYSKYMTGSFAEAIDDFNKFLEIESKKENPNTLLMTMTKEKLENARNKLSK
jgi:tetratricopeptide (TPR) repeat protein